MVLKLLTVIAVKPEVNVIVMISSQGLISSMKHTPRQSQAYMPLEALDVYHRSID